MTPVPGLMLMPDVPWPPHGGREVVSPHTLKALLDAGQPMQAMLTGPAADTNASAWPLVDRLRVHRIDEQPVDHATPPRRWLDRRWRHYWGWSDRALAALGRHVNQSTPRFIAAAGLHMLPALAAVGPEIPRIWLALDEPARFQRSLARSADRLHDKLKRWRLAAVFAAYQRTCRHAVDLAVAVSADDARALRRVGGFANVLNLPNGVDTDYYGPMPGPGEPHTAIFWGRLDFQPNVEALRWFVRRAWPTVVARTPTARLRVIGRHADPALRDQVGAGAGVEWIGPVDDLRPWVARSAAVVLPIRSGAGIKNKLLEAAAMARPIVAAPRAVDGLAAAGAWRVADEPEAWCAALEAVWRDAAAARAMGERARRWVAAHHCWARNAARLLECIASCERGGADPAPGAGVDAAEATRWAA